APKKLKFSKDFLRELLDVAIFQGIHIITAVGDSMNPTIESGDKLFILPFYAENNQIKEGGIYIIATPQGTLVKRIYPNPFTNTYTLKSDNHHVADIVIQGDELDSTKIIGRVVGILRHA
ncbi:MAG: S24/S26 family peptidase, partial [Nautiliaceae bacterium]